MTIVDDLQKVQEALDLFHITVDNEGRLASVAFGGGQPLRYAEAHREAKDALPRIIEAVKQMEWQPIETCPKDKSLFLAVQIDPVTGDYLDTIDTVTWGEDGSFIAEHGYTHWMPLPPPPQPKEEQ